MSHASWHVVGAELIQVKSKQIWPSSGVFITINWSIHVLIVLDLFKMVEQNTTKNLFKMGLFAVFPKSYTCESLMKLNSDSHLGTVGIFDEIQCLRRHFRLVFLLIWRSRTEFEQFITDDFIECGKWICGSISRNKQEYDTIHSKIPTPGYVSLYSRVPVWILQSGVALLGNFIVPVLYLALALSQVLSASSGISRNMILHSKIPTPGYVGQYSWVPAWVLQSGIAL